MPTMTEAEMDALDERINECVDAIADGNLAIGAVARGEVVDPTALDRAADAMAEMLAESRVTGPKWTTEDVESLRRLRALLSSEAPSSEARAVAAECRLIFAKAPGERAA
jgi:hypothetical protein